MQSLRARRCHFERESGEVITVPPNSIDQHFNADDKRPARLISAINRIFKNSGLNDFEQTRPRRSTTPT